MLMLRNFSLTACDATEKYCCSDSALMTLDKDVFAMPNCFFKLAICIPIAVKAAGATEKP